MERMLAKISRAIAEYELTNNEIIGCYITKIDDLDMLFGTKNIKKFEYNGESFYEAKNLVIYKR